MRLPCGTVLLMSCTWILVCQGFGNKISPSVKTHEIISFTNGQWFDGQSFKPMTGCIVEEKLVFRCPSRVVKTIDLHGGYVIPPFGEAHNHNVEGLNDIDKLVALILRTESFM